MHRRYHTLDAMRGVAAIIVVFDHCHLWLPGIWLPSAPQAVDLFFLLSGFVISKAYDSRFELGMTARQFLFQRYVRLYPLFLIGIGIGILSALLALISGHGTLTSREFFPATLSGLAMLPSPTWHSIADMVPFDKPAWSLIFELGANAVFAFAWRWLDTKALTMIVVVSAAVMGWLFYAADPFAGYSWHHAWMGVPRVSFGFFLGVLIARNYGPERVTTPLAWAVPLLLLPILYTSVAGGVMFTPNAKALDAFYVLIAFPALIVLGARLEPSNISMMTTLGSISYPIYAIHEPAFFFIWRILLAMRIQPIRLAPASGIAFVLVMIVVAWQLALLDARLQGVIKRRLKHASIPAIVVVAPISLPAVS